MWPALLTLLAPALAEPPDGDRVVAWQLGAALELSQSDTSQLLNPYGLHGGLTRPLLGPLSWEAGLGIYGLGPPREGDDAFHVRALAGGTLRVTARGRRGRPAFMGSVGADLALHVYRFVEWGSYGQHWPTEGVSVKPAPRFALGVRLAHEPPYALDLELGSRFWLFAGDLASVAPFAAVTASWGAW